MGSYIIKILIKRDPVDTNLCFFIHLIHEDDMKTKRYEIIKNKVCMLQMLLHSPKHCHL